MANTIAIFNQGGTPAPADFANRVQTFFNKDLLEALQFELVLATYGMKQSYPAIGDTIRFFRARKANTDGLLGLSAAESAGPGRAGTATALVEGTTPTRMTDVGVGYVDVQLKQRGQISSISDIVQAIDLLNTVKLHSKTLGEDAALGLDGIVRQALMVGLLNTDTTYGAGHPFERYPHITITDDSSTDYDTFKVTANVSKSNGKITRAVHLGCITQMRAANVPTIGGKYVAVMPPQVAHDMRQDTTWVSAATNVDTQNLYKRGKIELDGAVIVEADNYSVEGDTYQTQLGTTAITGTNTPVYSTWYLGRDAFGCVELNDKRAGASMMGPKLIVNATPDKGDPLNLKTVLGWKAFFGCKALHTAETSDVPHYVQLRTKSTF
jgi:N4-gp56 family major capsid protein